MSAAQGKTSTFRARGLLGLLGVAAIALTTACSSTPAAEGDDPTAAAATTSPAAPSPDPTTPATDTAAAASAQITIKEFAFEVPETVPAGATVTVVNEDSESHTVTSSDGEAFAVIVEGGATTTFVAPADAGSYDFVCDFHGNMKGTLVTS